MEQSYGNFKRNREKEKRNFMNIYKFEYIKLLNGLHFYKLIYKGFISQKSTFWCKLLHLCGKLPHFWCKLSHLGVIFRYADMETRTSIGIVIV